MERVVWWLGGSSGVDMCDKVWVWDVTYVNDKHVSHGLGLLISSVTSITRRI